MIQLVRVLLVIDRINNVLPDFSSSCLARSSYGTFGTHTVLEPDAACLASFPSFPAVTSTAPEEYRLVWVQQQAVEESLRLAVDDGFDTFLTRLRSSSSKTDAISGDQQEVLSVTTPSDAFEVIQRMQNSLLLAVPPETAWTLDTLLPPFYRSYILPQFPFPYLPVPDHAIDRLKRILSGVRFDPTVAALSSNISVEQIRRDVRWLTGEDSRSPIVSRHSFSSGSLLAAHWLKDQFEEAGAHCELRPFLPGFAPNIICFYPGASPDAPTVVVGAHYDSRGTFGSTRAPGADDDASGTTALLAIARTIARRGVRFQSRVELCAFAGEEQGLLGSFARATQLKLSNADITLMLQADMLAYRVPEEPPQLGLPELAGTPEVKQLVANVSGLYSPELSVGYSTACCSDDKSFQAHGFPTSSLFERAGPIADPMYHNSGDVSDREGYDFEQLKSIAKVLFATLLHAAGFSLPIDNVVAAPV